MDGSGGRGVVRVVHVRMIDACEPAPLGDTLTPDVRNPPLRRALTSPVSSWTGAGEN